MISKLSLRPELKQLFSGGLELGPFDEYFDVPSKFYSKGWPDKPGDWALFSDRTLLPLWQHEDKIYAIDTAANPNECISWYIECPEDFKIAASLDNAVFDMPELHVWEYGGDREEADEAMQFAQTVAFPDLDRLRILLSTEVEECTEAMIYEYRRRL